MGKRLAIAFLLAAASHLAAQDAAPFVDLVESLELELDASAPPVLGAKAKLVLRPGARGPLHFLLNRSLAIAKVTDQDGAALALGKGPPLGKGFHQEARAYSVALAPGVRAVHLEYSGKGADAATTRDWMGILLLAHDEIRMSRQTVFYPQIPLDLDGPAVAKWPSRVRVVVPRDFEAHVSGRPVLSADAKEGARAFAFENLHPSTLSFVAGRRVRSEAKLGEASVVVLLAEDHAALAQPLVEEVERVLAFYADRFGRIGPRTLGIVEMHGRGGSSYQWSAEGLITLDRGALGSKVPIATLAHEVAHLWWGQEVVASGRGERFLTESLAEYSSWRYLAERRGQAALRLAIAGARERWLAALHESRKECGLLDVRFTTPGYNALAYDHGPLALWSLHARIGTGGVDAALRDYRTKVGTRTGAQRTEADAFVAALRGVPGGEGLDLAWLEQGGHVHLEVSDVRFAGPSVSLRCRTGACPSGLPGALPATIPAVLWTAEGRISRVLSFADEVGVLRSDSAAILAFELDPEHSVLGTAVPRFFAHSLHIDVPANPRGESELGPLEVSVRYPRRIGAPNPEQVAALLESTGDARVTRVVAGASEDALLLTLDATLPGKRHVVRVPDTLLDQDGLPLPGGEIVITTRAVRADDERPRLVRTRPAFDATDVPTDLAEIHFEFSMPMRSGRGFATSRTRELAQEGWKFPRLGAASWRDERTLVWKLEKPLEAKTRYALPIAGHYKNRLGLGLAEGEVLLRFTTQ